MFGSVFRRLVAVVALTVGLGLTAVTTDAVASPTPVSSGSTAPAGGVTTNGGCCSDWWW